MASRGEPRGIPRCGRDDGFLNVERADQRETARPVMRSKYVAKRSLSRKISAAGGWVMRWSEARKRRK